jgi:hypothetical protein
MNIKYLAVVVVSGALLAGCAGEPAENMTTVTVKGTVTLSNGEAPEGKLYFRAFQLEALEGELAHPLSELGDFESDSAEYSHTLDYPADRGTGIAVHAWLDRDGDGIHCTAQVRQEPAGLATMAATPVDTAELNIVLTDNCRSANFFYPPVPAGAARPAGVN